MDQPVTNIRRDLGLAEKRFLKPGESEQRMEVAEHIRQFAKSNYPAFRDKRRKRLSVKGQKLCRFADRFEVCGKQYMMIQCIGCSQTIVLRRRCETRICDSCSKSYNAKVRRRQSQLIQHFPGKKNHWWMLVTFTKKTEPDYIPERSDAEKLFSHFRKLINEFWPKSKGCGSFAVLEIGENNNLHIHALVYGHFVLQKLLSKRWLRLTGDSQIVDIRSARNQRQCLSYILKYLTKQSKKSDPQALTNYLNLVIGLRRIRTYGVLYNFPLAFSEGCPCPLCKGKYLFKGFEDGRFVRIDALFFEEVLIVAHNLRN